MRMYLALCALGSKLLVFVVIIVMRANDFGSRTGDRTSPKVFDVPMLLAPKWVMSNYQCHLACKKTKYRTNAAMTPVENSARG